MGPKRGRKKTKLVKPKKVKATPKSSPTKRLNRNRIDEKIVINVVETVDTIERQPIRSSARIMKRKSTKDESNPIQQSITPKIKKQRQISGKNNVDFDEEKENSNNLVNVIKSDVSEEGKKTPMVVKQDVKVKKTNEDTQGDGDWRKLSCVQHVESITVDENLMFDQENNFATDYISRFVVIKTKQLVETVENPTAIALRSSVFERHHTNLELHENEKKFSELMEEIHHLKGRLKVSEEQASLATAQALNLEEQVVRLNKELQEERERFVINWKKQDSERLVEGAQWHANEQRFFLQKKYEEVVAAGKEQFDKSVKEIDSDRLTLTKEVDSYQRQLAVANRKIKEYKDKEKKNILKTTGKAVPQKHAEITKEESKSFLESTDEQINPEDDEFVEVIEDSISNQDPECDFVLEMEDSVLNPDPKCEFVLEMEDSVLNRIRMESILTNQEEEPTNIPTETDILKNDLCLSDSEVSEEESKDDQTDNYEYTHDDENDTASDFGMKTDQYSKDEIRKKAIKEGLIPSKKSEVVDVDSSKEENDSLKSKLLTCSTVLDVKREQQHVRTRTKSGNLNLSEEDDESDQSDASTLVNNGTSKQSKRRVSQINERNPKTQTLPPSRVSHASVKAIHNTGLRLKSVRKANEGNIKERLSAQYRGPIPVTQFGNGKICQKLMYDQKIQNRKKDTKDPHITSKSSLNLRPTTLEPRRGGKTHSHDEKHQMHRPTPELNNLRPTTLDSRKGGKTHGHDEKHQMHRPTPELNNLRPTTLDSRKGGKTHSHDEKHQMYRPTPELNNLRPTTLVSRKGGKTHGHDEKHQMYRPTPELNNLRPTTLVPRKGSKTHSHDEQQQMYRPTPELNNLRPTTLVPRKGSKTHSHDEQQQMGGGMQMWGLGPPEVFYQQFLNYMYSHSPASLIPLEDDSGETGQGDISSPDEQDKYIESPSSPTSGGNSTLSIEDIDDPTRIHSDEKWKCLTYLNAEPLNTLCHGLIEKLLKIKIEDFESDVFLKIVNLDWKTMVRFSKDLRSIADMAMARQIHETMRIHQETQLGTTSRDKATKMITIISQLKKIRHLNFQSLPDLVVEYFMTQIIANRLQNFKNDVTLLDKLGGFYAQLCQKFEMPEKSLDLILQGLYTRPPHAFALAFGILKIDHHRYPHLEFNQLNLKEKSILYCLSRPPRFNDSLGWKNLKRFLPSVVVGKLQDVTFDEFVEEVMVEMKELENAARLKEASKILSMLLMQRDPERTMEFVGKIMQSTTNEWKSNAISDGVFGAFILAIGNMFRDTADKISSETLKQLKSILLHLGCTTEGSDVLDKAFKIVMSKIDERIKRVNYEWKWTYNTKMKKKGTSKMRNPTSLVKIGSGLTHTRLHNDVNRWGSITSNSPHLSNLRIPRL